MPSKALRKIHHGRQKTRQPKLLEDEEEDIMRPPYNSSSSEEDNSANIEPTLFGYDNRSMEKEPCQLSFRESEQITSSLCGVRYGGVNNYRSRRGISTSTPRNRVESSKKYPVNNFLEQSRNTIEEILSKRNLKKKNNRAVYGKSNQSSSQSTAHSQLNSSQTSQLSPKKLKSIKLDCSDSEESEDEISPAFKPPSNEFLNFGRLESSEPNSFTKEYEILAHGNDNYSPTTKRKIHSSLTTSIEEDDGLLVKFKLPKIFDQTPSSSFSCPDSSFEAQLQKLSDESFERNTESPFQVHDDLKSKNEHLASSDLITLNSSQDHLDMTAKDIMCLTHITRCPMCNHPVSPNSLRTGDIMNTRRQEQFCLSHRKKAAKKEWELNRYPCIDWDNLDARISKHHSFLQKLIKGKDSYYRSLLKDRIDKGEDRNLRTATSNYIPGYYGLRGLRIISENVFRKFTPLLKKRIVQDRLIASRGYTPYVQSVLVPEVAVLLIQEDMLISLSEARNVMAESADVGELLHEEVRDDFQIASDSEEFDSL